MNRNDKGNASRAAALDRDKKNNKIARFYVTLSGKIVLPGFYFHRLLVN
jgi:hypothetical protein